MTRRVQLALVLAVAALICLVRAATLDSAAAAPAQPPPIWLRIGDKVQVVDAPIGCRVAVIKGAKTLDCRVAGQLAGTYGTMMTRNRLAVVRFRSQRTAKIV